MLTRSGVVVLAGLLGAFAWQPALGQEAGDADVEGPAALGMAQGEVAVEAADVGLGGAVRPGSWIGVRLAVTDRGVRQRELLVRVELRDADGDTTLYERQIASNPGRRQSLWTYLRLPFGFGGGDRLLVRVYEALAASDQGPRAGRLLGQNSIAPTTVLPPESGVLAVVGPAGAGLGDYATTGGQPFDSRGHEPTHVAAGLDPSTMPDAWMGLASAGEMIWTSGQPIALGAERADAVRTWVRAGGHLVVVLPPVGSAWLGGELNNPLASIMPDVIARRVEDYSTGLIAPLLASDADRPLPARMVAQVFDIPDGSRATPVITDARGRVLVVRRLVGVGAVTLVGPDVLGQGLERVGAPEAHAFWHRVLGRRGELTPWSARPGDQRPPERAVRHFDGAIDRAIAQTGSPASGVLMGFIVFIAYWLLAGPVGYALLRAWGLSRHAWVVFVATGAVFTAIAWTGATLLSPARVRGAHLTIIDHVYGQNIQRTRTWAGLIVPRYGRASVRLGGSPIAAAIAPWAGPDPAGSLGSFPDNRGYVLPAASPGGWSFPVRSTMKELTARWAGPPAWAMLTPVNAQGGPGELAATPRPAGLAPDRIHSEAVGRLVHDLPGPLHDVVVVVNPGMDPIRAGTGANRPISRATAFRLADPWAPGRLLDLAAITARDGRREGVFLTDLVDSRANRSARFGDLGTLPTDERSVSEQLVVASLLSQAAPPRSGVTGVASSATAATRRAMHGMDLGRWMTRPCILVLGHLGLGGEPAPSPTPLLVDGERPRLEGRVFVRWVYPLPASPPTIVAPTDASPAPEPPSGAGGSG